MNQAVKLEWEQKFGNLQDAEIMNIPPESSPQNSESDGAEIDGMYSDRRYKSRQHRNWDNNRKWNFNNIWHNKGKYNNYKNKDGYHKSKFENLKRNSYDNRSNNKTHLKQYIQDELNELIKLAIKCALQKSTQKNVNEINQQPETDVKPSQKLDWLANTYKAKAYFTDIESNPQYKFLEIYDVTSGRENGTTFKILIEKQKYYTLFDTGAKISVINTVAFEQLHLFDKIYDSNILVCNASGKSMDAKGKVTLKFEISDRRYTHMFIICDSLKWQIIIGQDFLIKNRMTLKWDDDKNNKAVEVLKDQFRTIVKAPEESKNMLRLKRAIMIPPRHTVVVEVTCKNILTIQHIVVPDSSLMFEKPNLKMEGMCYDNPKETQVNIL